MAIYRIGTFVPAPFVSLANVRERCLRAEAAWLAMATRSLRTETARDAREVAAEAARNAAIDSGRPDFVVAPQAAGGRIGARNGGFQERPHGFIGRR